LHGTDSQHVGLLELFQKAILELKQRQLMSNKLFEKGAVEILRQD